MDLEPIVLYLNKKDLAAVEIHAKINHVLGGSIIGCSTVKRYLHKQSFADSSILPLEDRETQGPDAIDNAILQALDERPFASLRQIAKMALVPMLTIRYRLVSKMAYKLRHCRWIPHTLLKAQKQTGVTPPKRLLDLPRSVQRQGRKYRVRLDEARFLLSN
jgi:hypothetical protein